MDLVPQGPLGPFLGIKNFVKNSVKRAQGLIGHKIDIENDQFSPEKKKKTECLKIQKHSVMSKKGLGVPRALDQCRKVIFRSYFGEITNV